MRIFAIVLLAVSLLAGCATDATTGKQSLDPQKLATGLAALHNALALAQIGYQDYALIAGKAADPKSLAAMQLIDDQLNLLGALAYNTVQPTQADIDKANAALVVVDQAKQALNPTSPTK